LSGFEDYRRVRSGYRLGTRRITRLVISSGVPRVNDPCSGAELRAEVAAFVRVCVSLAFTAAGGTSIT
jgi:hypothetical protein